MAPIVDQSSAISASSSTTAQSIGKAPTADVQAAKSDPTANIDLGKQEFCRCLSSTELNRIKDQFVASLPEIDTLKNYSSAILTVVSGNAPSAGTTSPEANSPVATTYSFLANFASSTLAALGITSLGKSVLTSAASLIDSAASLKALLGDESATTETISEARDQLKSNLDMFKRLQAMHQDASPEEAAQIAVLTEALQEQLAELEKAKEVAKQSICAQNDAAQSREDLTEKQKKEFTKITDQALSQLNAIGDAIAGVCSQIESYSPDNPDQGTIQELAADVQASLSEAGGIPLEVHEQFSSEAQSLAQAFGATGLAATISQIARQAHLHLQEFKLQFDRYQDAWATGMADGWKRGYSVDHYIHNQDSIFASFNNQYDLAALRERNKPFEHFREASSIDSTFEKSSTSTLHQLPDGFTSALDFSTLSRPILHGTFDREGRRRDEETRKRTKQASRYKDVTNQEAPLDLHGELSASNRLTTLLGKFFNRY